ncbi:hypothetical protein MXMO3_01814 [Maritalea myrionectae]|uniref:Uncharacterized protein n=1 Tax=Maritalea myrionectae TaxID=454601 RepID=A0A2R4MEQ2_9HYPH|nr:hypothetical protein [Maritalea myrionectae]AVX04339.1 hypothetical protein MXMO3_01814 [Maritalea myrionectae]
MTVRQNLTIRQSETWSYVYTYGGSSPIDLTGYTATFKIAGWGTGSVALGGAAGTVTLSLTSAQTEDLGEGSLTGYGAFADAVLGNREEYERDELQDIVRAYTVHITSGAGDVTRILEGTATIIRDVDV